VTITVAVPTAANKRIFKALNFRSSVVVKVSVKCLNASNLSGESTFLIDW
jgi:hypothetical protein